MVSRTLVSMLFVAGVACATAAPLQSMQLRKDTAAMLELKAGVRGDAAAPAPAPAGGEAKPAGGGDVVGQPVYYKLPLGAVPKLSIAMQCVLSLVALFFFTGCASFLIEDVWVKIKEKLSAKNKAEDNDLSQKLTARETVQAADSDAWIASMKSYITSIEKVTKQIPMVAVLIVFARLRSKVDLEGTDPSHKCKMAFVFVTGAIYLETLLACLDCGSSSLATTIMKSLQFLVKLALYSGVVIIIYCIMNDPKAAPGA